MILRKINAVLTVLLPLFQNRCQNPIRILQENVRDFEVFTYCVNLSKHSEELFCP